MPSGQPAGSWRYIIVAFFLDIISGALQHGFEARLIYRLDICIERLDQAFLHQFEKRVVEHYHSVQLTGLHRRRYLEGLAFADQVADGRRDDQDLERRHAAPAFFRQQGLRDHAF